MSGSEIIALAAVIVSGIGVVAGLGFNFWNSSSERTQRLKERAADEREWYRRTLFEKRLVAVQNAYAWWRRLVDVTSPDPSNPDPAAEAKAAAEAATEARTWYDNNSIYLEGFVSSSSYFIGMTNTVGGWAGSQRDNLTESSLENARKMIKQLGDSLLSAETTKTEDANAR